MLKNIDLHNLSKGVKNFDMTPLVDGRVLTALAAFGLFYTAKKIWAPIDFTYRHALRPRKNLVSRLGGNWALVTGAGDGIGEQLCYELARSGFNIILMSRTLDKMEIVAEKIRTDFHRDTRII